MIAQLLVVALALAGQPAAPAPRPEERVAETAAVCFLRELRAQLLGEIKAEQASALEVGGYVDKQKIYDIQQQLKHIDKRVDAETAALKREGVRPLPCNHHLIELASLCVGFAMMHTFPDTTSRDEVSAFCEGGQTRDLVNFFQITTGEQIPHWKGAQQAIINLSADRPPAVKQPAKP